MLQKQVEEEELEGEEACSTDSECDKYFASLEEDCDARDDPKSSAEVTREWANKCLEELLCKSIHQHYSI